MILGNCTVHTMDERMPRAASLAIAGGKVLGGVDSREDVIASHAHERISLQGACVVPGFVDAHVHFRGWAMARQRPSLVNASTLDAVLDRVRMHVAAEPDIAWVLASGWIEACVPPDTDVGALLDEAAGGRPAALVSKDGHALWCSSHALDALGMHSEDLVTGGGAIGRLADGRPTGILRERTAWQVRSRLPEDDLDDRAMAAAMREAARRGVTCVHDMDGARGLRTWRQLEHARGLTLRVVQHLLADDLPHAAALGVDQGFGSPRLQLGGVKAFADGTLGAGTAWLHDPEVAAPGSTPRTGIPLLDESALRRLSIEAGQAGLPLLVHAIGDAAATAVVDALEATQEHWLHLPVPPRIEHLQLVRADDIARCARLGIVASVQPTHLVTDRDAVEAHWSDRLEGAYAWRTMLAAGMGLVLGSDAPIEDLRPLAALHAATARDGGAHGLAAARGPWRPAESLEPADALAACTSWAADAGGMGGARGRLSPGRDADLVVLTDDPLRVGFDRVEVVATMVGGRWTHGAANLRRTG